MIGNIIDRITGSIGSFFNRRLGEDRARALKRTIGLICFAIFIVACFFKIQEWQVERHAKRVSDAGQQYLIWYFSKALRSQYLSTISQYTIMKMLKSAN